MLTSKQLKYIDKNWLLSIKEPAILVTGASGFIGRHLVTLLVEKAKRHNLKIIASDLGGRPSYLCQDKYSQIIYKEADLRSDEEIKNLIKDYKPQLIFHVGALFDFSAPLELLYDVNVNGVRRICEAAKEAGTKRIIYFSTAAIYDKSEKPIKEDSPLSPRDDYAKTKLEGEKEAFKFYGVNGMEVYTLRPTMVIGPFSHYGSGLIFYLLYKGWLIGPPAPLSRETHKGPVRGKIKGAIVNVKDVAIGAYLLALKDFKNLKVKSYSDIAFNIAEPSLETEKLLAAVAKKLPREYFLGIKTKWAPILKLGYQEDVRLSVPYMQLASNIGKIISEINNWAHYEKAHPLIPKPAMEYITRSLPLSCEKLEKWLGWRPRQRPEEVDETIKYYMQTHWEGFKRIAEIDEEGRKLIENYKFAKDLAEKLEDYENKKLTEGMEISLSNRKIDIKSLSILIKFLSKKYIGWEMLPRFIFDLPPELIGFLKYEMFNLINTKGDWSEKFSYFYHDLTHLNRKRLGLYLKAMLIFKLMQELERLRSFSKLKKLLPPKKYGILIYSDLGNIGIEIAPKDKGWQVIFPRKEVEEISNMDLRSAIKDFKKIRKLDVVIGTYLEQLEVDLGQVEFYRQLREKIGIYYLATAPLEQLLNSGQEFFNPLKDQYLFINKYNKVEFGLKIKDGKASMFLDREIIYYNRLLKHLFDPKGLIEEVEKVSKGREKITLIYIEEIRDRIDEILFPSVITKAYKVIKEKASWPIG